MPSGEMLKPAAGLTAAAAFASLTRTAIEDHRVWTHRSLAFKSERSEIAYRAAGSHLTDTKRWAAVHRVHHSTPDVNLINFVEVADYIDWSDGLPPSTEGLVDLPDEIFGLDPVLEGVSTDDAHEIGSAARRLVDGLYQPASSYDQYDAKRILLGNTPRYFYENKAQLKKARKHPLEFDHDNPPSLHDIRFLLRDPHSPALHRRGILGVMLDNVPLYSYAERNFEDPAFRPPDLKPDEVDVWTRENRDKIRYAYVGGMVAANVLLSRPSNKRELAASSALGAAASGLAVVALLIGGNTTNALGHGGDLKKLSFREFLEGKVYPKKDGTYTTNSRPLGPITLDEVGGQETHHDRPDKIAYSLEDYPEKLAEATFGSVLEFMTKHGLIFKLGDNFAGDIQRPDSPNEATLKIQDLRKKHLANT